MWRRKPAQGRRPDGNPPHMSKPATERGALPSRFPALRRLARELARFGTVGAFGVVVNTAVFNLCLRVLDVPSVRSGVVATAVATGTNYLGNRYWAYRHADKQRLHRELVLFLLFSGIGLVIENGALALSHYGLGFTSPFADNVAKYVVGLGLGTLFRFWSYRTWVFRTPQAELPPPVTVPAVPEPADRVPV